MLEDCQAMPGALPLLACLAPGYAHGAVARAGALHPRVPAVPACPSPTEQLQEGCPWQGQVMILQARPDEASPLPGRSWHSLTLCSINQKHLHTSGWSHSISSLSGVFHSICSSQRAPRILHTTTDLCIETVSCTGLNCCRVMPSQ